MECYIFTNWFVNIIPFKKAGHKSDFLIAYHNNVGHPSKALSPM